MIRTFENRCILKNYVIVLIPIFDNTYKGEIQVEIYMWALHHELVLFQKVGIVFAMYQRMRSKGTPWAGTILNLHHNDGVKWPEYNTFGGTN